MGRQANLPAFLLLRGRAGLAHFRGCTAGPGARTFPSPNCPAIQKKSNFSDSGLLKTEIVPLKATEPSARERAKSGDHGDHTGNPTSDCAVTPPFDRVPLFDYDLSGIEFSIFYENRARNLWGTPTGFLYKLV